MNAQVRSEAQADFLVDLLARCHVKAEKRLHADATFPYIVISDADREMMKAAMSDLNAHTRQQARANAKEHSIKMRTQATAEALMALLRKLGHAARIDSSRGTKAFPFIVTTDASRDIMMFAARQSAEQSGEMIGACSSQREADAVASLLKALGFTAAISRNPRARANPFNVATNADRATLRRCLTQAGEAEMKRCFAIADESLASIEPTSGLLAVAERCNECGAKLRPRDAGFCADCVNASITKNARQSKQQQR